MKYYDPINDKLVFIGSNASVDFWTKHWEPHFDDSQYHLQDFRNVFPVRLTKKYLPSESCVVDAGCGSGSVSIGLAQQGYQSIGVDFSKKTISKLEKLNKLPNVQFVFDDVFHLANIGDCSIDGYWSLGVIEHFWEGYDGILKQAHRVLKEDGMLFITFPSISPLRRLKCALGLYPKMSTLAEPEGFYQFALTKASVITDLKRCGFNVVEVKGLDAVKGIKDELSFLRPFLQRIYSSKKLSSKIIRFVLSKLLGDLTGHVTLIVAQKCS